MKVGGSQLALDQGIKAGRIIKSSVGGPSGMPLYFFPRREYTKESIFSQKVGGESGKGSASLGDLAEVAEDQLGFSWDPSGLIGSMDGLGISKATSCDGPTASASTSLFASMPMMGSAGAYVMACMLEWGWVGF